MHCKVAWGRRFMLQNFTKTYIDKDYARHRAEILWKREESYLPATMERVERIREGRRLEREVIKPMEKERAKLQREMEQITAQLKNKDEELRNTMRSLYYQQIHPLLRGELPQAEATSGMASKERSTFIRKCTVANCNGWLSSAWKCAVCENYACPDCFAVKGKVRGAEHTCDPGEKATADLIRKDTKPCPNCGTGIQRSEGCPVMFCTGCHKGFNWNTMEIITHGIHNPHYYEWRAAAGGGRPREAGDIPCGGVPHDDFIWLLTKSPERSYLASMHHCLTHMADYELNAFNPTRDRVNVVDLRTQFLLGEINKETAEQLLYKDEKTAEKNRAIHDIINTCVVAGSDIMRAFAETVRGVAAGVQRRETIYIYTETGKLNEKMVAAWKTFHTEAQLLWKFINTSMLEAGELHGITSMPIIAPNWRRITYLRRYSSREDYDPVLAECGYVYGNAKVRKLSPGEVITPLPAALVAPAPAPAPADAPSRIRASSPARAPATTAAINRLNTVINRLNDMSLVLPLPHLPTMRPIGSPSSDAEGQTPLRGSGGGAGGP